MLARIDLPALDTGIEVEEVMMSHYRMCLFNQFKTEKVHTALYSEDSSY